MSTNADSSLLLPEKSRLLYIGPPKTGTTSLQEAARSARSALYKNGVYYPGTGKNHRAEVSSLLGHADALALPGKDGQKPGANRSTATRVEPASVWRKLMADIEGEPSKRILISHELAATASHDEVMRFRDELGQNRIHVAITLRPMWAIFPSKWTETLKTGVSSSLDYWLERYYDPSDKTIATRTRRYLDHAALVERWVEIVGAQNVTVIVVDKSDRDLLTDTFERMLGLPEKTLTGAAVDGARTNRSMSRAEAQVVREVNERVYKPKETSWPLYMDVMYHGAIDHLLAARVPPKSEPRIQMPEWAIDRAVQEGSHVADRVAASGAQIVGSVDHLRSRPPERGTGETVGHEAMHQIAVDLLSGAALGALKYERDLLRKVKPAPKVAAKSEPNAPEQPIPAPKVEAKPALPQPKSVPATSPGPTAHRRIEQLPVAHVTSRTLLKVLVKRARRRVGKRIQGSN